MNCDTCQSQLCERVDAVPVDAGSAPLLADVLRHVSMSDEWLWLQLFTISTAQLLAGIVGLSALAFGLLLARRPALLHGKW